MVAVGMDVRIVSDSCLCMDFVVTVNEKMSQYSTLHTRFSIAPMSLLVQ